MAYKIGKCCQCSNQIAVQDANGLLASFMDNYRCGYLFYDYKNVRDGHKVVVAICRECLENPNLNKIVDELIDDESQAGTVETKNFIKSLGEPNRIERKL